MHFSYIRLKVYVFRLASDDGRHPRRPGTFCDHPGHRFARGDGHHPTGRVRFRDRPHLSRERMRPTRKNKSMPQVSRRATDWLARGRVSPAVARTFPKAPSWRTLVRRSWPLPGVPQTGVTSACAWYGKLSSHI